MQDEAENRGSGGGVNVGAPRAGDEWARDEWARDEWARDEWGVRYRCANPT